MTDIGIRLETLPPESLSAPRSGVGRPGSMAAAPATPGPSGSLGAQDVALTLGADLEAVEPVWRAFESEADHSFFQSFDWLAAWQRHVGARRGVVPAIVTGRHPDGGVLFILPLALERRGGVRRLTFLGAELCDYNAPLLAPRFGALLDGGECGALWARILDLVRADRRYGFDVVDLPKMPERVGVQRNPLTALRTLPNASGAYVAELAGSWEAFYARKRSASTRKKERRQLRQLAGFGEVRFVDQLEGAERLRTLDLLFAQKARAFARMGVRNIFARPGHRELFAGFASEPQSRHLVHLSRLEVGGTIAAISLGFVTPACYALVVSSYDDGPVARYGPGRAHLHELLRYALGNGFRFFDFTIGDEPYKQDWSDVRHTLHDHLSATNWRGTLVVGLTLGFRAAKRTIKQNPAMWRLFSAARSHVPALAARRAGRQDDGSGQEQAEGGPDA